MSRSKEQFIKQQEAEMIVNEEHDPEYQDYLSKQKYFIPKQQENGKEKKHSPKEKDVRG